MSQTTTRLSTRLPLHRLLSLFPHLPLFMPPPPLALVTRSASWTVWERPAYLCSLFVGHNP